MFFFGFGLSTKVNCFLNQRRQEVVLYDMRTKLNWRDKLEESSENLQKLQQIVKSESFVVFLLFLKADWICAQILSFFVVKDYDIFFM
jgi:hypothetical protein